MRRKSQARHFNSVETLEYSALQNKNTIQRRYNFQIILEIMVSEIKHLNFRAKESYFFSFLQNSSRFDFRSSSLTSNSSETSEENEDGVTSVQTLTECLQRIHRSPEDKTLLEALDLLQLLKKDFLQEMPLKVRSKASSQISRSSSAEIKSNPQIFHLLGRCFNLSINAKILSQCQFTDLAVAVRLLEDLETLENGLKFMSKEPKISLTNLTI